LNKIIKLYVLTGALAVSMTCHATEADDAHRWDVTRNALFQNRPLETPPENWLQLEVPVRAEDAAIVPVTLRVQMTQTPSLYVQRLYLLVDKNPSPIAAVFRFTPDSGRADIETRIRLEEYSNVRAVAETSDGHLYMVTRFVKASGGCSAPAGKDLEAALANVGRMKLRLDGGAAKLNTPSGVQLMVSHPNLSGMAMDQVTRLYVPAYFVRQIQVTYAGIPVMTADVDFSISENPSFHFYFTPRQPGELVAEVVDTKDQRYHQGLSVTPVAGTN